MVIVQMDVKRLVFLFETLLFLFLVDHRRRMIGDVYGTGDGPDVFHVLLCVAIQPTVNTLENKNKIRGCCYKGIIFKYQS